MTGFKSRISKKVWVAVAVVLVSICVGYRADDWTRFDHRTFKVVSVESGNDLTIQIGGRTQSIKLMGIAGTDPSRQWLSDHLSGQAVSLLLDCPQTREADGRLRASVFLDQLNVSVELVSAGLAFADRREKTVMDGLIDPAESDARKKKRGMWNNLTEAQMPAWRQQWLRSLSHSTHEAAARN